MINNKEDLQLYLNEDMNHMQEFDKKDRMIRKVSKDSYYMSYLYVKYLRKEEYFYNTKKNVIHTLLYLWYFRKKNILGNKLGFKIPRNCFGPGLQIEHHGTIIVNENAKIGANAILHGNNCIGNNGKPGNAPIIGDNCEFGFGANVIGNVYLGDNIIIGANAFVNKNYPGNSVLVGVPARIKYEWREK